MRDILAVLSWWLLIQLIGLVAWPLAFRLLRFLPDRGYTAAKPLGLLLISFTLWLLGSLGLMPNSLGGIVFALILVTAASARVLNRVGGVAALREWLSEHRAMVLVYEALFAMAMCGWALFRAANPAINSTEKPMEFAFLNAILRSSSFPPHDPWLSGFAISYYYFGYVMMAVMTRLSGVLPGIAYNVSHGLWFALIAGGSFGAAFNLAQAAARSVVHNRPSAIGHKPGAIAAGVLAAVLITFMGNLEGTLELAHLNGLGSAGFWKWLDIKDISGPPADGGGLRYMWWWRASRVVHDYTLKGEDQEVIDEFPFFSFLNGDLHPHTLAYPFVFLAISLALNLYQSTGQDAKGKTYDAADRFDLAAYIMRPADLEWPDLILYAICLGALGFLNTWDFPIYLMLVLAAFALRLRREVNRFDRVLSDVAALGVILGFLGFVLYLPFYLSFQSQARGILPNLFNPTRLPQFLVMFGAFAVPCALFVLALTATRARVSAWRYWLGALGWTFALLVGVMLFALLVALISPAGQTVLKAWLTKTPVPGTDIRDVGLVLSAQLTGRLLNPWTALLLALALVMIVKLLDHLSDSDTSPDDDIPLTAPSVPFILLLVLFGAALAFSVEFVFLADLFWTRMNTVFKFYYQVWALWGVASACALCLMLQDQRLWMPFRAVTGIVCALCIAGGLVYPLMAIATVGDWTHPTLDGTAWVAQSASDDYAAIQWLNQNVTDAPVILEAPGLSYHAELSRISAFTGLPTVLGWDFHEVQWRGEGAEPSRRRADIEKIYSTRDVRQALTLLDKYAISYVYVGPVEYAMFPEGTSKFDAMMDVVFRSGSVTIYRR